MSQSPQSFITPLLNPLIIPTPKAILFDLDGTLADTALDLGAAVNIMRQKRHLPPLAITELRTMASSGSRGLLLAGFGMQTDHPDFSAYQQEFLEIYCQTLCEKTVFFDGIVELIHSLNRHGIIWGVVTNKPKRFTDPLMMELEKRYALPASQVIVSGDTTAHAKPHPEPMRYALEKIALNADEVIYVGDDLRDIQAAQAVNMRSVAALYGYLGEHAPQSWGANYTIHHPLALLDLLGLKTQDA